MVDHELQFYVNYGAFSQGKSCNKNLKFLDAFFTISPEILILAPINGLKLDIISMLTLPEI
ncbi:hypothetical protein T02_5104, partial [Trichinella nativa]